MPERPTTDEPIDTGRWKPDHSGGWVCWTLDDDGRTAYATIDDENPDRWRVDGGIIDDPPCLLATDWIALARIIEAQA